MTNIPKPDGTQYNSACSGAADRPAVDHHRRPLLPRRQPQPGLRPGAVRDVGAAGHGTATAGRHAQRRHGAAGRTTTSRSPSSTSRSTASRRCRSAARRRRSGQKVTLAGWGSLARWTRPRARTCSRARGGPDGRPPTGVIGVSPAKTTSACLYDSGAPYFVPSGKPAAARVGRERRPGLPARPARDDRPRRRGRRLDRRERSVKVKYTNGPRFSRSPFFARQGNS